MADGSPSNPIPSSPIARARSSPFGCWRWLGHVPGPRRPARAGQAVPGGADRLLALAPRGAARGFPSSRGPDAIGWGPRLFPTRSAFEIAMAGAMAVLAGSYCFSPPSSPGGALILGLAAARAHAALPAWPACVPPASKWSGEMAGRTAAISGQTVELLAEVRNRDTRARRFGELRAVASPSVAIEIEAQAGSVPAGGRLEVVVKLRGKRVGASAVCSARLEAAGQSACSKCLTFSNPSRRGGKRPSGAGDGAAGAAPSGRGAGWLASAAQWGRH